jgi:hypothetical protein
VFSLSDLDVYKTPELYAGTIAHTALISKNGRWGMLISDDDHAVVGGSSLFIDTLAAVFPTRSDLLEYGWIDEHTTTTPPPVQLAAFLRLVRKNQRDPMTWLPTNLRHLYGAEAANNAMREAGLISEPNVPRAGGAE